MEQRSPSPLKPGELVTITALQNDEAASGEFVDSSADGVRIKSNAKFEIGSLLKLESGDEVMMTEVRDCKPHESEYIMGLLVLAALEKSELKRLLREAVAEPSGSTRSAAELLAVA